MHHRAGAAATEHASPARFGPARDTRGDATRRRSDRKDRLASFGIEGGAARAEQRRPQARRRARAERMHKRGAGREPSAREPSARTPIRRRVLVEQRSHSRQRSLRCSTSTVHCKRGSRGPCRSKLFNAAAMPRAALAGVLIPPRSATSCPSWRRPARGCTTGPGRHHWPSETSTPVPSSRSHWGTTGANPVRRSAARGRAERAPSGSRATPLPTEAPSAADGCTIAPATDAPSRTAQPVPTSARSAATEHASPARFGPARGFATALNASGHSTTADTKA